MALPSPKELKKLADACRKAGIVTFKADGIEFTLADKPQPKVVKKALKQTNNSPVISQDDWDGLSEIDRLLWSSAGLEDISPAGQES